MRNYPNAPKGMQMLMDRQSLTVAQAALRTGIAEQTLRAILAGRQTSISTRNMFFLAKLFRMPMADLIDFFS